MPECLRCGACCFSQSETYVRVTGADWTRLGDAAERVAHFIGNRAYLRMAGGHCAALAIRPAVSEAGAAGGGPGEFFCTIYERRPAVCRDLARGAPECEGERARKADAAEAAGAWAQAGGVADGSVLRPAPELAGGSGTR